MLFSPTSCCLILLIGGREAPLFLSKIKGVVFIISNGGIDTENHYPYRGVEGRCDPVRKNYKVVSIDGYEDVPRNERALQKAVAHQPVSVAIEASGRAFQLYSSGVFTRKCGEQVDHGVVAVGYGSENGVDYWIVRNSWSTKWGENGYVKWSVM
ncbi:hypothetical protein K7X08_018774 [Anisodus acutangulus]|uniref:Peptidase C1A papain C-terminal domain-containing protein n=1 Tax=Anisodus acutangulus TaxID=402998 RepID=A0A9Q1LYB3_9SOLA|nr:hypothetical protein K7X08_018774 [Anisodus acutangulus]